MAPSFQRVQVRQSTHTAGQAGVKTPIQKLDLLDMNLLQMDLLHMNFLQMNLLHMNLSHTTN